MWKFYAQAACQFVTWSCYQKQVISIRLLSYTYGMTRGLRFSTTIRITFFSTFEVDVELRVGETSSCIQRKKSIEIDMHCAIPTYSGNCTFPPTKLKLKITRWMYKVQVWLTFSYRIKYLVYVLTLKWIYEIKAMTHNDINWSTIG